MKKICLFTAITVFSYAGWALGQKVGMMTAFGLSFVGSVLGVFVGWWINENYFE
ncbi:hypothetical protein [Puniceicoccus vermicola]|uniref:Uncharacterized protein n=1 Tax=Puniceicoccus vermicola TaxID=388746 RepID=A0A7X1AUE6_9BACT|nr:hypothetical protein [Puniceicoccus vermicola]MBC2600203.1 hypothetical protein [Puniceicoccus vermicola]